MEDHGAPWRMFLGVIGLAFFVGLIGGGFAGAGVALLVDRDSDSTPVAQSTSRDSGPSTVLNISENSAATEAYQKVSAAVVTLIVQAQSTDSLGRRTQETNLGSGVIIDNRGYLVTNEHVVRGATRITVKFQSGEERPGALVGHDHPFSDIAVIRIQPDGATVSPVADSDALTPGQGVIAIGSVAFGPTLLDFRNSITRGVVSGVHRRWPRDDTVMEDVIQTDAAINHGNSGGGLFTLNGDLVGITTTVIRGTQTGQQVQGVAFAIPSNVFMPVVEQIIRDGKTVRPFDGITHRQLTADIAQQARLAIREGAYVVEVAADSPAERAGVQKGDVITRVGDVAITDDQPYLNTLAKYQPDMTVPFSIQRGSQELTLNVRLGTR